MQTPDIQTTSPEPRTYTQKADSGNEMTRAWCDGCGAGIWLRSASKPGLTFLKAGEFEESISGAFQILDSRPRVLVIGLDGTNLRVSCESILRIEIESLWLLTEEIIMTGLFEPGEIPNPTMENWLKNMEPWETPAKGTEKTAQEGFD